MAPGQVYSTGVGPHKHVRGNKRRSSSPAVLRCDMDTFVDSGEMLKPENVSYGGTGRCAASATNSNSPHDYSSSHDCRPFRNSEDRAPPDHTSLIMDALTCKPTGVPKHAQLEGKSMACAELGDGGQHDAARVAASRRSCTRCITYCVAGYRHRLARYYYTVEKRLSHRRWQVMVILGLIGCTIGVLGGIFFAIAAPGIADANAGPIKPRARTLVDAMWDIWCFMADPGTHGSQTEPLGRIVSFVATIAGKYCLPSCTAPTRRMIPPSPSVQLVTPGSMRTTSYLYF